MRRVDRQIVTAARAAALGTVGLVLFAMCGNDECMDNKNSLPLAGFYAATESAPALRVDSLTVYGVGAPGDSVLLDCGSVTELYLPFRIDEEETTYVFRYDNKAAAERGLEDRVTFRYDIRPIFTGAACGMVYEYEMRAIETTHVFIDSVTCPSGIIDNRPVQNIRVYFRYGDEEMGI